MHSELTPAQQEAILNFQAITENWDFDIAYEMLTRNRWDVSVILTKAASQDYFNFLHSQVSVPPQHVPLISPPSVPEPEQAEQPGIISTITNKVFNIGSGLLSIVKNLWNYYGIL